MFAFQFPTPFPCGAVGFLPIGRASAGRLTRQESAVVFACEVGDTYSAAPSRLDVTAVGVTSPERAANGMSPVVESAEQGATTNVSTTLAARANLSFMLRPRLMGAAGEAERRVAGQELWVPAILARGTTFAPTHEEHL